MRKSEIRSLLRWLNKRRALAKQAAYARRRKWWKAEFDKAPWVRRSGKGAG